MADSKQLPQYVSHKRVWALKIKAVEPETRAPGTCSICGEPMPDGEEMFKFHGYSGECPKPPLPRPGAIITPEDSDYAAFPVDAEYVAKHKPQAGGYYVVYADGYKSWSPAAAFEEGYTLVGPQ
jgi:hypothetical protein